MTRLRTASLSALGLLSACASGPPTSVRVTLRAQPGLNPDVVGLPNPVQTHVYLLRASEVFSNTDYFQLADKERTVLGADLLAQADQILRPGQTQTVNLPVPPGTKMVGITASFRNIDGGTWRAVTPVHGQVVVDLGAQTLQVTQSR